MPTMLLRPSTTTSLPLTSTSLRCSSSMHPAGVHGTASGGRPPRRHMLPMLVAEKPSTSLETLISSSTSASLMWRGSGSCTRMPCTFGSSLSARTHASSSSCETLSGNSLSTE